MHQDFSKLFLSGGCCGSTSKKTVVGGWAWAWWLVTDVQRLSLEVIVITIFLRLVACSKIVTGGKSLTLTHKKTHSNRWDNTTVQVMTLNPVCENVETAQGVPLTVTGVAQVSSLAGI